MFLTPHPYLRNDVLDFCSRCSKDRCSDLDGILKSYLIPASAKERIRRELASLGIRERNVFPDLEHLARDLARDEYADFR